MVQRGALAAGMGTWTGNHSFRATGITAYLTNGGTLENAAAMADHASTRTTQLYDRGRDDITLDEVEPVSNDLNAALARFDRLGFKVDGGSIECRMMSDTRDEEVHLTRAVE